MTDENHTQPPVMDERLWPTPYHWSQEQAALMKKQRWPFLAMRIYPEDEIRLMDPQEHRRRVVALRPLCRRALTALVLLRCAQAGPKRLERWQWRLSKARYAMADLMQEDFRLYGEVEHMLTDQYDLACWSVTLKERLPINLLPERCPWTLHEVLEITFWP